MADVFAVDPDARVVGLDFGLELARIWRVADTPFSGVKREASAERQDGCEEKGST
ncbi:MAG: hypothetical protein R2724_24985 [Bryobacterales bacterium]